LSPPFKINCTPNSAPILLALNVDHLSSAANICGNDCVALNASKERLVP
jgi:hypothetical protein